MMLKPLLVLLLVCSIHSPPLRAEDAKLFKRMETMGEAALQGEHAARESALSGGRGARHLGPPPTTSNPHPETFGEHFTGNSSPEGSSSSEGNVSPEITSHPDSETTGERSEPTPSPRRVTFRSDSQNHYYPHDSPDSFERPPSPPRPSKKSYFARLRQKISDFFQDIRWFFRGLKKKNKVAKSTSRAFNRPFKGLDGLAHLPSPGPEFDQELEVIAQDIAKRQSIDPNRLVPVLKARLEEVRELNAQFEQLTDQMLNPTSETILKNIQPFLHSRKSRSADPLAKLGEHLSEYKVRNLEEDRERIAQSLLNNEKYLAHAHGFLGPGNVLSREVKTILEERIESGSWKVAPGVNAESIVRDIQLLQGRLAEFLHWAQDVDVSFAENQEIKQISIKLMLSIQEIAQKLDQSFEKPLTFFSILKDIKNSDMYKSFERELMAPNSRAAYELQLIEPWGISRTLDKIRIKDLPRREIRGARSTIESWRMLEAQGPLALRNAQIRLIIHRKARAMEARLREFLTPLGIEYVSEKLAFTSKFQKDSQVKN